MRIRSIALGLCLAAALAPVSTLASHGEEDAATAATLAETGIRLWGLSLDGQAAPILSAAATRSPEDTVLGTYLIEALAATDGDDGALASHADALAAREESAANAYLLGFARLRQNKLDDAYESLIRAQELDAEAPLVTLALAEAHNQIFDRAGTLERLRQAPASGADDLLTAVRKAALAASVSRLDKAPLETSRAALEQVVARHPAAARAWIALGRCASLTGHNHQAEAAFARALSLAPKDHDLFDERAKHLFGGSGDLDGFAALVLEHLGDCEGCRGRRDRFARNMGRAGQRELAVALLTEARLDSDRYDSWVERLLARNEQDAAFYRLRERASSPPSFVTGEAAKAKALADTVSVLPRLVLLERAGSQWNERFRAEVLMDSEVRAHLDKCVALAIDVGEGKVADELEALFPPDLGASYPRAVLLGPTGGPLAVLARDDRPDEAAEELGKGLTAFSAMDIDALTAGRERPWAATVAAARADHAGPTAVLVADDDDEWSERFGRVLADPVIQAKLSDHALARITAAAAENSYGVAAPALVLLDRKGGVRARLPGYRNRTMLGRALSALPAGADGSAEGIAWHENFDQALAVAKTTGRPLLVDVYTDWCHWCHVLDEKTFPAADVIARVDDAFVPLKANPEIDFTFANAYPVRGFPTTLVVSPEGVVIKQFAGYMPAAAYLAELELDQELELARKLGPARLADLQQRLRGAESFARRMPKQALAQLQALAADYPDVPAVFYALARAAGQAGEHEASLAALRKAVAAPEPVDGDAVSGVFHRSKAEPDTLHADVLALAKELAGERGAHILEAYARRRDGDNAIAAAEEATRLAPDRAAAWLALTELQLLAGERDAARAAADKALAIDAQSREVAALDAMLLRLAGDRDESESARPAEGDDRTGDATTRIEALAEKLAGKQLLEETAAARWILAALAPRDADTLNQYGYALANAGIELDLAVASLERAIALDDDDDDEHIYDSLAWTYYKKGDLQKAHEAVTQALKLDPTLAAREEFRYHMGAIYAKLGLAHMARAKLQPIAASAEPQADDHSVGALAYRELKALDGGEGESAM